MMASVWCRMLKMRILPTCRRWTDCFHHLKYSLNTRCKLSSVEPNQSSHTHVIVCVCVADRCTTPCVQCGTVLPKRKLNWGITVRIRTAPTPLWSWILVWIQHRIPLQSVRAVCPAWAQSSTTTSVASKQGEGPQPSLRWSLNITPEVGLNHKYCFTGFHKFPFSCLYNKMFKYVFREVSLSKCLDFISASFLTCYTCQQPQKLSFWTERSRLQSAFRKTKNVSVCRFQHFSR